MACFTLYCWKYCKVTFFVWLLLAKQYHFALPQTFVVVIVGGLSFSLTVLRVVSSVF